MFNLNNIIPVFDEVNQQHYLLDLPNKTTSAKLRQFKAELKEHRKRHPSYDKSTYDKIIKAIDYEFLRRKKHFLIRQKIVSLFSGYLLYVHPEIGIQYFPKESDKSFIYITLTETYIILKKYCVKHYKFVITTVLTLAQIILVIIAI